MLLYSKSSFSVRQKKSFRQFFFCVCKIIHLTNVTVLPNLLRLLTRINGLGLHIDIRCETLPNSQCLDENNFNFFEFKTTI